jgi:hypothetical protein
LPVYNPNQADADNDNININIGDACDTVVERRGRVRPVAAAIANLSPGSSSLVPTAKAIT